jgi:hypothetical protein
MALVSPRKSDADDVVAALSIIKGNFGKNLGATRTPNKMIADATTHDL